MLFTHLLTKPLAILTPGQLAELKTHWDTSTHPKGIYTVTLEVFEGTAVLSSSSTTFEVLGTTETGEGLTGMITATPDPVYQGKDETLTYSITNMGNEDISSLDVKVLIVDPETGEIKIELNSLYPVGRGETVTGARMVSTAGLVPKTYLAILQAATSAMSEARALASTTFEVMPGIEVTKTIPDVTNLLVWVNGSCDGDHGYNKVKEKSSKNDDGEICIRVDLLEGILGEAVESYYIVYDKEEFQAELRNPYYTDFLILGNRHPLEDHFYEELREQVYSGKGVISSLYLKHGEAHKHKGGHGEDYDPLFGITYEGQLSGKEHEVELLDSPVSAAGVLDARGKAARVEASEGATVAGWIKEEKGHHKGKEEDYPAIVLNEYGSGRAVYYAFDLGLTLNDENYDQISELLRSSIAYVHNPAVASTFYPYQMIPVEVEVKSLGGAFDLRITERYPEEMKLYDPVTGQWIAENPRTVQIHLEPDETVRILYYALTPEAGGTYTIQTEVGYVERGGYSFYQNLSIEIVVDGDTAVMTGDIVTVLEALPVTGKEREKVDDAVRYLEKVLDRVVVSNEEIEKNIRDVLKAIKSLLSVTSVDISDVRLMLDDLLMAEEGWFYYENAG